MAYNVAALQLFKIFGCHVSLNSSHPPKLHNHFAKIVGDLTRHPHRILLSELVNPWIPHCISLESILHGRIPNFARSNPTHTLPHRLKSMGRSIDLHPGSTASTIRGAAHPLSKLVFPWLFNTRILNGIPKRMSKLPDFLRVKIA